MSRNERRADARHEELMTVLKQVVRVLDRPATTADAPSGVSYAEVARRSLGLQAELKTARKLCGEANAALEAQTKAREALNRDYHRVCADLSRVTKAKDASETEYANHVIEMDRVIAALADQSSDLEEALNVEKMRNAALFVEFYEATQARLRNVLAYRAKSLELNEGARAAAQLATALREEEELAERIADVNIQLRVQVDEYQSALTECQLDLKTAEAEIAKLKAVPTGETSRGGDLVLTEIAAQIREWALQGRTDRQIVSFINNRREPRNWVNEMGVGMIRELVVPQ